MSRIGDRQLKVLASIDKAQDDLNTRTLDLVSALRRAAGILEETEEGCVAFEAAFDAQTAIENFIEWYGGQS